MVQPLRSTDGIYQKDLAFKMSIKSGRRPRVIMDVSKNSGTPKSSILIRFSIINHPFWGILICGNAHMYSKFILPVDSTNNQQFS